MAQTKPNVEFIGFVSRESRTRYLAKRFAPILRGRVLDVGCFEAPLREMLPQIVDTGVDLAGTPEMPTPIQGKGATGLGDINYSVFLSPVKVDKVIWGVGPSISLPTTTDNQLGSEKWSAGPTAVFLTQPKWGSMGILMRQLWSFAGDSDRN
jgi:hypothetical protein